MDGYINKPLLQDLALFLQSLVFFLAFFRGTEGFQVMNSDLGASTGLSKCVLCSGLVIVDIFFFLVSSM